MNLVFALIGLVACAGLGAMGWRGKRTPWMVSVASLIAGICLGLLL